MKKFQKGPGEYNLTEEYFNITHPYGHWKDTGLKLAGDAVCSFTVMFLEMWNAIKKSDSDYEAYLVKPSYHAKEQDFEQTFPMCREVV